MQKIIYHRNLSQEETAIIKGFRLPGNFKTTEYKQQNISIVCRMCKTVVNSSCLLVKYSDGVWMLDALATNQNNINIVQVEDIVVTRSFCCKCKEVISREDIINYYKDFIKKECNFLNSFKRKNVSYKSLYEPVIAAAIRLASFENKPDNWKTFIPRDVLNLIGGSK